MDPSTKMPQYCEAGHGPFTRASDNIKKYTVSKVVDRHHSEESHLPFLLDQDV